MNNIISIFKEKNLIIFIVSLLLFLNSGFYIKYLPALSPVYILLYINLLFLCFYIFFKKNISLTYSSILGLIFVIYILSTQFILTGRPEAILGSAATIMFYILGTIYLPKLTLKQVYFIADLMLIFYIILYGADTLYRLAIFGFNIAKLFIGTSFYSMKVNCWLYGDTNPLAIAAASMFFLAFYLYLKTKKFKYMIYLLLYSLITFFTFSRSVIIAIIVTLSIYFILHIIKVLRKRSNYKTLTQIKLKTFIYFIVLFIMLIIAIFGGIKIITYLMTDNSFMTKIGLMKDIGNFIQKAPLNELILGIGYNNGRITEYSSRGYAHAYLTTYIIETGFIGYILVTSFLISVIAETKKNIILIFAFFIMGISYIGHAQLHLFYTVLILIWYFEKYDRRQNA